MAEANGSGKTTLREIVLKDWVTALIAVGGLFLSAYWINDYFWKGQKDYEWARSDRQRKVELWAETSTLASSLMLTLNRQADLHEQLRKLSRTKRLTALERTQIDEKVRKFEEEAGKRKELGGQLAGKLRFAKAYFGEDVAERIDRWRATFNRIPSTQIVRLTPDSDFVKETLGLLESMERIIWRELDRGGTSTPKEGQR